MELQQRLKLLWDLWPNKDQDQLRLKHGRDRREGGGRREERTAEGEEEGGINCSLSKFLKWNRHSPIIFSEIFELVQHCLLGPRLHICVLVLKHSFHSMHPHCRVSKIKWKSAKTLKKFCHWTRTPLSLSEGYSLLLWTHLCCIAGILLCFFKFVLCHFCFVVGCWGKTMQYQWRGV